MKHVLRYIICFQLFASNLFAQTVVRINIDGVINPVTAEHFHNAISKAQDEKAECLLLCLNTPGGLLKSTRVIVSDILEAKIPVVVFVAPGGAQAGSAGVFITLSAHIAAMAPGTNIGAAHPVTLQRSMDSVLSDKLTNDAAAFIRSIALKRHRNVEWAENAVRKSFSYSEAEALEDSAIDLIANDLMDLLKKIDGRVIETSGGTKDLQTQNARVVLYEMSFVQKMLNVISDPNIAYILFLLGLFGLLFELFNPGALLPGIVGIIALILSFYTMHSLPINYAGLALIVFAIVLFLLEIKIISHGLLAIGGIVSLVLGSLMLLPNRSPLEYAQISRLVIAVTSAVTALLFLFVIGIGLAAQKRKVVTGSEAMKGATAISMGALDPMGTVLFEGESWNAESVSGPIAAGEKLRVLEMKNLKLYVEKF